MKGHVWLASYPKSGNTWFRAFLANFLLNGDRPASINHLDTGPTAGDRESFDAALGYDSGDLSFDEVDALRPEVYLHQARQQTTTWYRKTHDAYIVLPDGRPLFPPEATAGAVYFVRNPLDVCVSAAHHNGEESFDRMIEHMSNPEAAISSKTAMELPQMRQIQLTWSAHVLSWVEAAGQRVHVMRYEDMQADPLRVFRAAIGFLGLPDDRTRIEKALAFSSFKELRSQEQATGFAEKLPRARVFFRKGEAGSWREALTSAQAQKIIADHGAVMRRFGYLDDAGQPVF